MTSLPIQNSETRLWWQGGARGQVRQTQAEGFEGQSQPGTWLALMLFLHRTDLIFHGNTMEIQWKYNGHTMDIQWTYIGNAM